MSRPNPGSDEAIDLGCVCPVMDNNHGRWAPYPPNGWWMRPDCPLHRPARDGADADSATSAGGGAEGDQSNASDLGMPGEGR